MSGNRTTLSPEVIPHLDYKTAQVPVSLPLCTAIGTRYVSDDRRALSVLS